MCRLELDWTDATEMTVSTDRIVEAFDVFGHLHGSRLAVRADALLDPLLLQASEEGFSDGTVPAVRAPVNTGLEIVGLAEAPPCIAPMLFPNPNESESCGVVENEQPSIPLP